MDSLEAAILLPVGVSGICRSGEHPVMHTKRQGRKGLNPKEGRSRQAERGAPALSEFGATQPLEGDS